MLKYPNNAPIMGASRNGLRDMWNAFMVKGAKFSPNDIPLCPTTATSLPVRLISYDEAKCIHNRELQKGNTDYRCSKKSGESKTASSNKKRRL